jgi:hypothetical protein
MLYFPVGTTLQELADTNQPLLMTEGEFKAIALRRAVCLDSNASTRFVPVAISGVSNYRSKIGRKLDPTGAYVDETGPIPDLSRIAWEQRQVVIIFDRDAETNDKVQKARWGLTGELRSRGARVSWFEWPEEAPAAKGVDDLLAAIGPEKVSVIEASLDNDAGVPNLLRFYHNDSGNAERLVALYGPVLRYCHAFRKWLVWDGRRWVIDETGRARKLAKETHLSFLRQAIEAKNEAAEKFAKESLDAKRIAPTLSLAEPEIFITVADLDRDPWALSFLNGTVDLRTAELRPHRRTDFITKLVRYEYKPYAPCPRWLRFLGEVMGGGPDASEAELERADRMVSYLQRALGYSLTASTRDKVVFVPYGSGSNGKTTMLAVFRELLGEYAGLLQVETLMTRQENSNTQADLADLRGLRFVQTSETEEGQRLAQGKLKRITQGMGTIMAARKYENPVEFPETLKVWVDTKRRPMRQAR